MYFSKRWSVLLFFIYLLSRYLNYTIFSHYSIDEIARYDLEAAFTLIEQVSGQKTLLFIGHQVGATALLAYGSINPSKIKEKVAGAALICPLAELRNSGTLLSRLIGRHPDFIWKYKEIFGMDKFLSNYKYQKTVSKFISKSGLLMFLFVVDKQIKYGPEKELTAVSLLYLLYLTLKFCYDIHIFIL